MERGYVFLFNICWFRKLTDRTIAECKIQIFLYPDPQPWDLLIFVIHSLVLFSFPALFFIKSGFPERFVRQNGSSIMS